MAWTAIAALTDGQVPNAALMNQLAGNVDYLRAPNAYVYQVTAGQTTTSLSFVSMGANFEQASFAMSGGKMLVLLTGMVRVTGAGTEIGNFDIEIDGSRIGHSTGGIMAVQRETNAGSITATPPYMANIGYIISGLSVGNHAVKMMWKVATGGTLRIGHDGSVVRFYIKEL